MDTLREARAICRTRWAAMVTATVAMLAPAFALAVGAALLVDSSTLDFEDGGQRPRFDHIEPGLLVLGFVSAIGMLLACAACVKLATADVSGGRALAFALSRLPALLVLYVVASVAIGIGVFAFFVPAVWLAVAWSLAIPVLVLEDAGPLRALGRSFALVRGRWWATLGTLLVLLLASFVALLIASNLIAIVAGTPGGGAASAVVFVAVSTLAFAFALPYVATVLALLFKERAEGAAEPVEAASDEWLPPQAPPGPEGP
jgi:hypothetical protein